MKKRYYINTQSGEKLGPFKNKDEATAQQLNHKESTLTEYFELNKRETKLRSYSPWLHTFATTFSFVGMFVVISLGLFLIWYGWAKTEETKDWVASPAYLIIDNIEEETHSALFIPRESELKIYGKFSYAVGEQEYSSTDMGLYTDEDINTLKDPLDTRAYLGELVTTCYVNPNNPEEAVLFNNADGVTIIYHMGGFVIFCGILGLVSAIYGRNKRKFLMQLKEEQII